MLLHKLLPTLTHRWYPYIIRLWSSLLSPILSLFLAVPINDKDYIIFGGSDAPTVLGVLYSIGAVIEGNRIYISFLDVPRSNVGWSERTFAGDNHTTNNKRQQ